MSYKLLLDSESEENASLELLLFQPSHWYVAMMCVMCTKQGLVSIHVAISIHITLILIA